MSEARRHHFIPRMYLRRFADKKRRVRVYDRASGRRFTTNIANAAVETGFYDIVREDGQRDLAAEQVLSRIEAAASAALDRVSVLNFPPSQADRESIVTFLATMRTRTRESRDIRDGMVDALGTHLREGEEMTDEAIGALFRRSGIAAPRANDHVAGTFGHAPPIADLFYGMRWLLGYCPGGIVLGDHPIAAHKEAPEPLQGYGLANADAVYVPIGTRYVLIMTPVAFGLQERPIPLSPDNVLFVNSLMCERAYQYVFQLPMDPDLDSVMPEGPRPLFEVNGRPYFGR